MQKKKKPGLGITISQLNKDLIDTPKGLEKAQTALLRGSSKLVDTSGASELQRMKSSNKLILASTSKDDLL